MKNLSRELKRLEIIYVVGVKGEKSVVKKE